MTLGQRQTLYVMVIFKDIGAVKFLLPSSYTMPPPPQLFPFLAFLKTEYHHAAQVSLKLPIFLV